MSKFLIGSLLSMVVTACVAPPTDNASATLMQQMAPTGRLRVAISVGVTGNPFRATLNPTTNEAHGVPVDLSIALGQKLGVPVDFVQYTNYADLLNAAGHNVWDVTFITFDEARGKLIDFGPAYFHSEFTYLVAAGSTIRNPYEIDRPGVRIAVAEGSVTASNRERLLKSATLLRFQTLAQIRDQVLAGNVDAVAAGRETLVGLARQIPGARVLDGSFNTEGVAIAAPPHRPLALAYLADFIETAKTTSLVRKAFDDAGFKDAAVAPLGSKVQ